MALLFNFVFPPCRMMGVQNGKDRPRGVQERMLQL